ncbi:MAG: hypothetical protein HN402_07930 [Candidatus Scalindua sp.]|jgi:hypothetical protein|nr:hypothetical protein [Candidatus Scalindua sp.]MBT6757785.1 hypothetical protein [Candidatus Jacksonbacteria bacterium]
MNQAIPAVEQHYHIQDLIDKQTKRSEDREYHRERVKRIEERDQVLRDSKSHVLTDFWCDKCKEDFKSTAYRQVEVDWTNSAQRIAFYKTKCWNGHWCIRQITDKHKDAFYTKSKLVRLDQGNHYADTVQPYETGFNLLYGKKDYANIK